EGLRGFESIEPRVGDLQNMTTGHWMQALCLISFASLLCGSRGTAPGQATLNLMPIPDEVQIGSGSLRIDASFSVALTGHTEARLDRAVQRFQQQLFHQSA